MKQRPIIKLTIIAAFVVGLIACGGGGGGSSGGAATSAGSTPPPTGSAGVATWDTSKWDDPNSKWAP